MLSALFRCFPTLVEQSGRTDNCPSAFRLLLDYERRAYGRSSIAFLSLRLVSTIDPVRDLPIHHTLKALLVLPQAADPPGPDGSAFDSTHAGDIERLSVRPHPLRNVAHAHLPSFPTPIAEITSVSITSTSMHHQSPEPLNRCRHACSATSSPKRINEYKPAPRPPSPSSTRNTANTKRTIGKPKNKKRRQARENLSAFIGKKGPTELHPVAQNASKVSSPFFGGHLQLRPLRRQPQKV